MPASVLKESRKGSAQHPFFSKLPRKIRDVIYRFHVHAGKEYRCRVKQSSEDLGSGGDPGPHRFILEDIGRFLVNKQFLQEATHVAIAYSRLVIPVNHFHDVILQVGAEERRSCYLTMGMKDSSMLGKFRHIEFEIQDECDDELVSLSKDKFRSLSTGLSTLRPLLTMGLRSQD